MQRIRFALRNLFKSPLVSLVVMLSLGLGIGANTAIFSLLDQVVLRSLPIEKPEEIVLATAPGEFKGGSSRTNDAGGMDYIFNHSVFRALEKQPAGLRGLAGFFPYTSNLAFGNETVQGKILIVSGQYFPVLGVQPLIGRLIAPADDAGAGNPVAVLAYSYWQTRLGGQPEVLNRPISVNGQVFTVVGIAPPGFNGITLGSTPDLYVPMAFKPLLTPGWNGTDRENDYWIYILGRLNSGITRQQAETALNQTYRGLLEPQANALHFDPKRKERFLRSHLSLLDGRQGNSGVRDDNRSALVILFIATALVLAIAMANAANLMLARSAQRRRELAIRVALGAGRGDIISQMLTEALLLSAGGCLVGLAFAYITLKLLLAELAGDSPIFFLTPRLEWPVLLFGFALSMLTGLLFGLYPAWEAARQSLAATLKDEAGQSSGTRGIARVRRVLVAVQVMLSAVLLIPTGLFLKSLLNVLHVDLGLNTESVIGFSLNPRLNRYTDSESKALFERVDRELAALPGARTVTDCTVPLIGGSNWGTDIAVKGFTGSDNNAKYNKIGPGFFGKIGIPLIAGREFTEADTAAAPKVAIVNEELARHFFNGQNPVGRHFSRHDGKSGAADVEIVGLVKDSRYSSVRREPPPLFFVPWLAENDVNYINFYVRSALPTSQMVQQIRRMMTRVDRNLPAMELRTLDDTVRQNIRNDRLILQLAGVFAGLATLLAMLGLYGVMAHSVTRRTREIGIRIALGAAPGKIRAMVLRELSIILAAGLVLGVGCAFALVKYIKTQLYGVKAYDTAVIAGAVLVLTVTAAVAGWFPARRAARVNPLDALRYE